MDRDVIKFVDEKCVIDADSIKVKNITDFTYVLNFMAFNNELKRNEEYNIEMEYSYEMDEDEDGYYVESICSRVGYFQQLKKDTRKFSKIAEMIWDELEDYIMETYE